jgi:ribonuclease R
VRRVHERPSERRLKELTEFIRHLGIDTGNLQDRFEIRRVVELARNLPIRQAVHMSVLRSMQKAVYSPRDEGHYALGSDAYCHFTSPIRRYPDLVIHRMVGAILDGKRPRADFDYLARTGQQCSETEQRAEQAERELIKLKLINYLAQRIGTELPAIITGVESWGVFVQGTELPAEGLVPVNLLPLDQYTFDPQARTMMGRRKDHQFRLGDPVRVRVERADPDRRELTFALASSDSEAAHGRSGEQRQRSADASQRPTRSAPGHRAGGPGKKSVRPAARQPGRNSSEKRRKPKSR